MHVSTAEKLAASAACLHGVWMHACAGPMYKLRTWDEAWDRLLCHCLMHSWKCNLPMKLCSLSHKLAASGAVPVGAQDCPTTESRCSAVCQLKSGIVAIKGM